VLPIDDYTPGKTLHTGSRTQVVAAIRTRDGREVVLKGYLDRSRAHAEARARRELQELQKLQGRGIPEVLELRMEQTPVLVLERLPGLSLANWVASGLPSTQSFLEVAIQLADVLARIHEARLLHRDLNPTNVVVDPATLQTHVIDFELCRPLGTALQGGEARVGSSGVAGMLPFISPEQTGRMDRGVDVRSDLYSLGATLYYMLVGRPPFEETDRLALIHAHMAILPQPPSSVRPGVPATLSRIVSKLLQKTPEDRYQTAHALRRDLSECRQQLLRAGVIQDDLPLGTADAPYRPLFSRKLYGRDAEARALQEAYERTAAGTPGVVLLVGAPGIGKSALIDALRKPLSQTGGHLASAKFDQYRSDRPYAGFAQALAALAQQLLTESDERLAEWRRELCEGLGPIAGALTGLVPDLVPVLGNVPPVPLLAPAATRARLALAVQRFIHAAATREHPLVLSLDDLQWSDAASRDLLRDLLLGPRPGALLVVGAYRDSEVGAGHPFHALLEELERSSVSVLPIQLAPLGEEPCAAMLADALGRRADETRSLASCVARKTGSVPLLIQQFIYHMYDVGRIRFEPGVGWSWDEAALAAADVPEDAVELMTAKIARLEAGVASVLQIASCMGDQFDLETLAGVTDRAPEQIESALFQLCDEGLLAPDQRGLRFTHDRIREAAQRCLGDVQKAIIHRQAARLLLERTRPEDLARHVFEISDHLQQAGALLDDVEQRQRAMQIHLLAGKCALVSGAPVTAARYLSAARAHFHEDHWKTHAELGFDLFMQSAESALQTRDHVSASALLDTLERQDLALLLRAQVAAKRTVLNSLSLVPEEALRRLLENLARFGVRWPAQPSLWRTRWAIWRTDRALRGPLDETAFRPLPPGDHSRWLAPLTLMGAGGATIGMVSPRLLCLMTSFIVREYRRYGMLPVLPLSLVAYASSRRLLIGIPSERDRYIEAGIAWNAKIPNPTQAPLVEYMLHAFVYPCSRPRRTVLEPLRSISEQLFEVGNVEYGFYALAHRLVLLTLAGDPLGTLEREYATLAERGSRGRKHPHDIVAPALLSLRSGMEEFSGPKLADVTTHLMAMREARMGPWVVWSMVLAFLGRFDELRRIAAQVREIGIPQGVAVDLLFFEGVAAALDASPDRRRLQGNLKQLERWARQSADFEHMMHGLAAERARLQGRASAALALYTQASSAALRQGYRHHGAFLHERRAALLQTLRREAEAAQALAKASALYSEWGALAKAQSLRGDGTAPESAAG
jgi:hypothetical protein